MPKLTRDEQETLIRAAADDPERDYGSEDLKIERRLEKLGYQHRRDQPYGWRGRIPSDRVEMVRPQRR